MKNGIVDKLTVVITANLIPSHPDITQVRNVIESLDLLGLDKDTQIIITHDEIHPNKLALLKKARERYNEYFKNLKKYCETVCNYKNILITKREEWGHLTRNVYQGMSLVKTSHVLLIQHDLPFVEQIPIYDLLQLVINNPDIKHLKFNQTPNLLRGWDAGSTGYKTAECIAAFKEVVIDGVKLCKTLAWSDQNHLTTKKHYDEVVFVDCDVENKTTFMEGVLNWKNADNPERYGTYIYGEFGKKATIRNADGANTYYQDFIFDAEYCKRKYKEFQIFNISFRELKEMYVDKYGYKDCCNPAFDFEIYGKEELVKVKNVNFRELYKHWLDWQGSRTGKRYNQNTSSSLKIILKTKNERFLLESWLKYHIVLVGEDNIAVIDNNSDDPEVLSIYERYNVLVYRDGGHPDHYHQTRKYLKFYEDIQTSSLFHIFLDTDEYLCFFDHSLNQIDNSKLHEFLIANKHNHTLSTSWLCNNYYGKDYASPMDVVDFSLDDSGGDIIKGKSIFLNTSKNNNRTHNSASKDVTFCPELLVLHLNKANVEERIKSKIAFVKSQHPDWTEDNFFEKNIEIKKDWKHSNREIANYYENAELFLDKLKAKPNQPYIYTDVISSTINGRTPTTSIKGGSNVFDTIFNSFSVGLLQNRVDLRNISQSYKNLHKSKFVKLSDLRQYVHAELQKKFVASDEDKLTTLRLILKTKNEPFLLENWLLYHSKLVGWENLIVLDNASDDPAVLGIYEKYKEKPFVLLSYSESANTVHDIKSMQLFYDTVRLTCKYLCFLDTDEFLTFFSKNKNVFDFSELIAQLENTSSEAFGSIWLHNSPKSSYINSNDFTQFKDFELNPYRLVNGVNYGKPIVSSNSGIFKKMSQIGVNLCHNNSIPKIQTLSGLIVLHLDKTQIDVRIRNNFSLLRSRRLSSHAQDGEILEITLEDLDIIQRVLADGSLLTEEFVEQYKHIQYHKFQEILNYLKNRNSYVCSKATYDSSHNLETNIIQYTVGLVDKYEQRAMYAGSAVNNLAEVDCLFVEPVAAKL